MAAGSRTVTAAAQAVGVCAALSLPAAIVFGRAAMAVCLGLSAITLIVAAVGGMRWPLWTRRTQLVAILTIFLGVGWLPSIVGSLMPLASAWTAVRLASFVFGALLLVTFLAEDRSPHRERIFLAAMLAALVFSCLALFGDGRLLAFRSHGKPVAALMLKASASAIACAIPVMVYLGWRLGTWWRLIAWVNVMLGLGVMWGTHSKSSLAGLLVALFVAALVFGLRFTSWRIILSGAVAAVLVGIASLHSLTTQAPDDTVGGYHLFLPHRVIDTHRQVIWQFTLDRFAERPWFGWGLNVSNYIPGAEKTIPELNAEFIPSHPHNWVIEILTEGGIIGLLPLLSIVVGVAIAGGRAYLRTLDPAWLSWLVLWLTYWSAGSFNFSAWNTSWQSSGLVLAALVLSRLPPKTRP